jgi:hypothetical protein
MIGAQEHAHDVTVHAVGDDLARRAEEGDAAVEALLCPFAIGKLGHPRATADTAGQQALQNCGMLRLALEIGRLVGPVRFHRARAQGCSGQILCGADFLVLSQIEQQLMLRRRTGDRTDAEGHVGAQACFAREPPLGKFQASLVADEKRELTMTLNRARGAVDIGLLLEMDRLWHLYDRAALVPVEQAFAELAIAGPYVAEIAAAVQKDAAAADGVEHPAFVIGRDLGDVGRTRALAVEIGQLAEPDGAVADVVVVGKVEKRKTLGGIKEIGKAIGDHALKAVDDRNIGFHEMLLVCGLGSMQAARLRPVCGMG